MLFVLAYPPSRQCLYAFHFIYTYPFFYGGGGGGCVFLVEEGREELED